MNDYITAFPEDWEVHTQAEWENFIIFGKFHPTAEDMFKALKKEEEYAIQ